jgi:hypothetical protein
MKLRDLERQRLRWLDAINNPRPMVKVGRSIQERELEKVNNQIKKVKKSLGLTR